LTPFPSRQHLSVSFLRKAHGLLFPSLTAWPPSYDRKADECITLFFPKALPEIYDRGFPPFPPPGEGFGQAPPLFPPLSFPSFAKEVRFNHLSVTVFFSTACVVSPGFYPFCPGFFFSSPLYEEIEGFSFYLLWLQNYKDFFIYLSDR